MFSHRRTTGSANVERTTARSLSRILRRATTPSVIESGGFTPPDGTTSYSEREPSRSRRGAPPPPPPRSPAPRGRPPPGPRRGARLPPPPRSPAEDPFSPPLLLASLSA